MSIVGFIHVFSVGIWFGLVAVESVVELVGRTHIERERTASKIHFYTDIFVEVPIILMVLISGSILFDFEKMSCLYAVKIVCGLIAIATNLLCVVFVVQRERAVHSINAQQLRMHTNKVFFTILALPFAAVAFLIGLGMLGVI